MQKIKYKALSPCGTYDDYAVIDAILLFVGDNRGLIFLPKDEHGSGCLVWCKPIVEKHEDGFEMWVETDEKDYINLEAKDYKKVLSLFTKNQKEKLLGKK